MSKIQTAVEWLIEQMLKQGYFDGSKPLSFTTLDHLQQQAFEMEKQQKIEFANNYGFDKCGYDYERAEQYYNETFKKD